MKRFWRGWFGGGHEKVHQLPIRRIISNPFQPRKKLDEEELKRLMRSIEEFGVITPIIVRPIEGSRSYGLVAGQRRLICCRRLEMSTVPAVIRDLTDHQVTEISLLENLHRVDLTHLEQAESFERLTHEFVRVTEEDLARRLGMEVSEITECQELLKLPMVVREAVITGLISDKHARLLLPLGCEEDQVKLITRIHKEDLSVRQTEYLVRRMQQAVVAGVPAVSAPAASASLNELEGAVSELIKEVGTNRRFDRERLRFLVEQIQRRVSADPSEALRPFWETGSAWEANGGSHLTRHALAAGALSLYLAEPLGVSREEALRLGSCALLFDVGMQAVPAEALSVGGPLTDPGRRAIQEHVRHGYRILSQIARDEPQLLDVVRYHHERIDGSGYLEGISGQDRLGRWPQLIGLVDAYTAMCEPRPHRPSMHPRKAMQVVILEAHRGRFDREMVRTFLCQLSLYPIGCEVRLSTGEVARVVRANPDDVHHPVVCVTRDPAGGAVAHPVEVDLAERVDIDISCGV
jgi:ParB family chromosome partitioning protein